MSWPGEQHAACQEHNGRAPSLTKFNSREIPDLGACFYKTHYTAAMPEVVMVSGMVIQQGRRGFLTMADAVPAFRPPSRLERVFNRLFGILVGLGLGMSHNYLLQVRGRKSGRLYSTPVNLLVLDGRTYLVAPRGNTQWVRNARQGGDIWLKHGRRRDRFRVREIPDAEKPRLLQAYLSQFRLTVQRYFPVPAASPLTAFAAIASRYPVFEVESGNGLPPG